MVFTKDELIQEYCKQNSISEIGWGMQKSQPGNVSQMIYLFTQTAQRLKDNGRLNIVSRSTWPSTQLSSQDLMSPFGKRSWPAPPNPMIRLTPASRAIKYNIHIQLWLCTNAVLFSLSIQTSFILTIPSTTTPLYWIAPKPKPPKNSKPFS